MQTTKLDVETMARNIAHVYSLATAAERHDGATWYPRANAIMREWARFHNRSVANVASLTAALSPQVRWEQNLILAADVLDNADGASQPVIGANWRKAERIRDERLETPLNKYPTGPKVHNFALNLAGDYSAVTVDTHAMQIALGSPTAAGRLSTFANYAPYAQAYRIAAQRVGLDASTLQAITWVTWKRMYPPEDKRALLRELRTAF